MQQLVLMKAAITIGDDDKDFVLAPHGMRCKPCMSMFNKHQSEAWDTTVMVHVRLTEIARVVIGIIVFIGYVAPEGGEEQQADAGFGGES